MRKASSSLKYRKEGKNVLYVAIKLEQDVLWCPFMPGLNYSFPTGSLFIPMVITEFIKPILIKRGSI